MNIQFNRRVVTGGRPDPLDDVAKVESFLVELGETRLPAIARDAGFSAEEWADVEQLARRFDRYGVE